MSADWTLRDLERLARRAGWKVCPRCRAVVEKADQDSCDHMTCAQCHHEFCWSCLADRTVIFAHGNHHHRPGCKFHAPYSGIDEYLPERCVRCAVRGSACRAPAGDAPALFGRYYSAVLDACIRWLRGAMADGSCSLAL